MHTDTWLRAAVALSFLAPACAARKDFCVEACTSGVQSVRFSDAGPGFPAVCHSELAGLSLLLCTRLYCEDVKNLNETCKAGGVLPSLQDADRYTEDDLRRLTRVTAENRTNQDVVAELVVPAEPFFEIWVATLSATEYVYRFHNIYGWAMGGYWAVIVLIGLVARITRKGPESRLAAWYKANVSVPMAFGSACPREVGWATVPPRDQAFAAVLFAALNVVLSSVGYKFFEGNLYYPTVTSQVLRYVSDRTGIISFANFPLIWLFGTRNNIVSWVTGWDFPTCTNFHRWVARVATVQAVIHSIGYTILVIRGGFDPSIQNNADQSEGGWSRFTMWWTYRFWWAGELATVLMCALVALSSYWVRKKHYETFLVSHIVLSILILVTMLMHVAIFNGTYDPLVIVPVLIWLFDRLLRVIRIGLFNPAFWSTKAAATYDADANLVRLEISMAKSFYKFAPGTYCYLLVLHDRTFSQSHPFTIASIKSSRANDESSDEEGPLLQPRTSFELDAASDSLDDPDKAVILIRPYDQFTGRLRDLAEKGMLRVMVEGPYGLTRPLDRFDKVLFLTGGSGIAIPLSYLDMLLKKGSVVSSVAVHWAVREAAFAAKTVSEDMGGYLRDERFSVITYTAAGAYRADDILAEMEAMSEKVEARRERLDCAQRIARAAREMEDDGKRNLAVVCCGPAGMADDCRAAVAKEIRAGRGRIEYFEESYNW